MLLFIVVVDVVLRVFCCLLLSVSVVFCWFAVASLAACFALSCLNLCRNLSLSLPLPLSLLCFVFTFAFAWLSLLFWLLFSFSFVVPYLQPVVNRP